VSSVTKPDLGTALLLRRRTNQIDIFPKVRVFLDSIARNSIKSKTTYSSGLSLLQNFLNIEGGEQRHKFHGYNCENILEPLLENRINVYELLDSFVSHVLATKPEIAPRSLRLYIAALRSYFAYYDIDVIPSKFRRKVKMPKFYREDETAIDAQDIRNILLVCNNRRLKAYLLVLASGGMRAVEGLAIRLNDINQDVSPTKIHIRKEYSKTKVARDIYISDEATQYLNQWIDWKYRDKERPTRTTKDDDLVFTFYKSTDPTVMYVNICEEFQKLLAVAGLDERKETGIHKRRKITLHSMRRYVKSVISDQASQDYSEWYLGHSKSPYYTKKEPERREIYAIKCMKYLTFLDYTTIEATGKSIEAKLSEKEKEIQLLKKYQEVRDGALASLSDQVTRLIQEIEIIKNQQK
jgi:integrase